MARTASVTFTLLVSAWVLGSACGGDEMPVDEELPESPQLLPAADIDTGWVWFELVDAQSTASREVRVKNGGREDLVISNLRIDGRDPELFAIGTTGSLTVASEATLVVPVTFAPTAAGVYHAWIRLTSNAENLPEIGFLMVGLARDPALALHTPVIAPLSDFFDVETTAGTDASLFPRVFNLGNESLEVTDLQITGADAGLFSLPEGELDLPFFLIPGARIDLSLTYDPTSAGEHEAVLQITSNDPATPVLDLTLIGHAQ